MSIRDNLLVQLPFFPNDFGATKVIQFGEHIEIVGSGDGNSAAILKIVDKLESDPFRADLSHA